MICDEARFLLGLLLDDELSTEMIPSVMCHLDNCIECQNEWQELLKMRSSFREFAEEVRLDIEGDIKLLDKRLMEVRTRSKLPKVIISRQYFVACLLGFALLSGALIYSVVFTKVPWKLEDIRTDYVSTAGVATKFDLEELQKHVEFDLEELQKHVEFDVGVLAIPGFSLIGAEVLHVPDRKSACLAKLVYRSKSGAAKGDIICYQACRGQIESKYLRNKILASYRSILSGRLDGLSLIYWQSDDRDLLLVSSISEQELIDIAKGIEPYST